MCSLCGSYPCHHLCPNYEPKKTHMRCSICGEYICVGDEYVLNSIDEIACRDCITAYKDDIEWFGGRIKCAEDESIF